MVGHLLTHGQAGVGHFFKSFVDLMPAVLVAGHVHQVPGVGSSEREELAPQVELSVSGLHEFVTLGTRCVIREIDGCTAVAPFANSEGRHTRHIQFTFQFCGTRATNWPECNPNMLNREETLLLLVASKLQAVG